ncbi:hypothetical protein JCM8547_002436 [Rhodosporidiobolus lusitaniae]
MDPSFAVDPALSGAPVTSASNIDPALDPLLAGFDPATAASLAVALDNQPDQPVAVADNDTPDERLHKLRTDYRAAAVSHWATLFLHHAGEEFDVEAFERDLMNNEDDAFLPHFLGRILNTLANDRNTNSTNWLNALRRSYNRRVTDRSDNPFYTYVKIPAAQVEAERAAEREQEEREWEEKYGTQYPGEDQARSIYAEEEMRLKEAEKLRSRGTGSAKSVKPGSKAALLAAGISSGAGEVHESGAADVNMSGQTDEAKVPVTEEALDDGFNAELADAVAQDAAEGVKKEEQDGGEVEDDEWYEEQRAVEWKDLSLETKLDAIYNVCEWHMVDPERQFRRYLQWDGESAWRLDPIGLDAAGNKYYHLADDRLWVQRTPPASNPSQPADAGVAEHQAAVGALENGPHGQQGIKKPKTLLGLKAGPRDKSKKGTVTGTVRVKLKKDKATGRYLQVAEEGDLAAAAATEGGEEEDVKPEREEEEVEMPVWEREYWEERARAENTPGFVEWEAVCITLDDWKAFSPRFAGSIDPNEVELSSKVASLIPGIEEDIANRAKEREEKAAEAALRAAGADEEASRLAAERLASESRLPYRSTRHGPRPNYSEGAFGVAAATTGTRSGSASASAAPEEAKGESREERLRKREEEKRKAEEEAAQQAAMEAWEQQREIARQQNGGELPYELMTDEEKAVHEKNLEKERKKREAEEKKRQSEEKKKARAKERRAELKAERDAEEAEERAMAEAHAQAAAQRATAAQPAPAAYALPVPPEGGAVDDPWWMDCEICGLCGWNVDDGQELICCDDCEEWQHLPCHAQQDAMNGLPARPFHDEEYQWVCGRCQGAVPRTGRPPLPNPPNAPLPVTSAAFSNKRRASDVNGRSKKAKTSKAAAAPAQQVPYGHGAHPLYHPSAYSHPIAVQNYTASPSSSSTPAPAPVEQSPPAQQQAAAAPAAGEAMSYDQLLALVQSNPALLGQLPAEYQSHFSSLLGIPLPPSVSSPPPGQTYLAQYIIDRLTQLGVKTMFGVPGDFSLSFLNFVEAEPNINWIGCCNELNASYAADGYSRLKQAQLSREPNRGGVLGLSALCTTYGVGECSAANGMAGAYAERVPIIHIVGAPSTKLQKQNAKVIHHTLGPNGRFDVFKKATEEMTCAQAYLTSADGAAEEIDRILLAALSTAQPAYLHLPSDLVMSPVDATRLEKHLVPSPLADVTEPGTSAADLERLPAGKTVDGETKERLEFVSSEIARLWEEAKDPIVIVDACAIRYGLNYRVKDFIERTGVRWFTTPMGRTAIDEDPAAGFGGTYIAQLSDEATREAVEKSDLVFQIGAIRSDLNTGLWSSTLKPSSIIELHSSFTQIQYAHYPSVGFHLLLPVLSKMLHPKPDLRKQLALSPPASPIPQGHPDDLIKHAFLWPLVGSFLRENDIVVAEVGTSSFGMLTLPLPKGATFVSQVLWGSIGWSVGATLGALLAAQESSTPRRTILFCGDGSFQLTVQEVATMVRYGLKPILVLINNEGYTIERMIDGPTAAFNDIALFNWDHLLPLLTPPGEPVGKKYTASTRGELEAILADEEFGRTDTIKILEVKTGRLDAPKALYRLGEVTRQINA